MREPYYGFTPEEVEQCPTCGSLLDPQGHCFYCWQDEQDNYEDWKDIGRDFNDFE